MSDSCDKDEQEAEQIVLAPEKKQKPSLHATLQALDGRNWMELFSGAVAMPEALQPAQPAKRQQSARNVLLARLLHLPGLHFSKLPVDRESGQKRAGR